VSDDRLDDALGKVRMHASAFMGAGSSVAASIAADRSARDVPRLLAALDEVLTLHGPAAGWCCYCTDAYGDEVPWPCVTVQVVSTALLGEGEG